MIQKTVIITLLLLIFGCNKITEPLIEVPPARDGGEENAVFYYNDFTTKEDTAGFTGYGYWDLRSDTSDSKITKCLFVTGGCIVPHVRYELLIKKEGRFILYVRGKKLESGGSVMLQDADRNSISVHIKDSVWTFYQSVDTLIVTDDKPLLLELMSGGIKSASMLIDQISIIQINYENQENNYRH
jgi:hypothetical protein